MYNKNNIDVPKNYDFVPFPASVNNKFVTSLSKRRGNNSGYAAIEITAVDNLFLGSGFCSFGGNNTGIISETQNFIPGASLKGAVRQIARAASEACIPQDRIEIPKFDNRGNRIFGKPDNGAPLLTAKQSRKCFVKPDDNGNVSICIVCDMFGAMSLGSKVRFTDFTAEKCGNELIRVPQQFSPHTDSGEYWYFDENKAFYKGYKFYYTDCEERNLTANKTISAVKKNTVFKGKVFFNNLFDEQLELLLYSLGAGQNISLKLGGFKADGFGTVKTKCTELIVNGKSRQASEIAKKYASDNSGYLNELEEILAYRER